MEVRYQRQLLATFLAASCPLQKDHSCMEITISSVCCCICLPPGHDSVGEFLAFLTHEELKLDLSFSNGERIYDKGMHLPLSICSQNLRI